MTTITETTSPAPSRVPTDLCLKRLAEDVCKLPHDHFGPHDWPAERARFARNPFSRPPEPVDNVFDADVEHRPFTGWARQQAKTTKHTCGGPVFGRKTPGCPRCDELIAGAAPVQWNVSRRRDDDAQRREEIRRHFASHEHRTWCRQGFCTFGDW